MFPKTYGLKGRARTLQKNSLNWEGVTLFNSLPKYLRIWKGTPQSFKNKLDLFLQNIPDQPEVNRDKPGGKTINGDPSNSIADWIRVLQLNDDGCDEAKTIRDDDKTTIPADCEACITCNISCTSLKGSGLNPGHC